MTTGERSDPATRIEDLRASIEAGMDWYSGDRGLDLTNYVTGVVAPRFQDILNDLAVQIDHRHRLEHSDSSDTTDHFVVHYTSVATIASILQGQATKRAQGATLDRFGTSLRLYDSAHLNDPDEGNYLIRNLNAQGKYEWISEGSIAHAYIASFIIPHSENDVSDNLAFWRTYGKEGEGCSLKVRVPRSRLREVIYDPIEVNRTVQQLLPFLETLDPLVNVHDRVLRREIRATLADAFRESLGRIQYLYKDKAYGYEGECRFVITRSQVKDDDIFFDYRVEASSSGHLRHYCEHEDLDIEEMAVSGSSVTLGPRVLRADDVRRSLEVLRRRAGLADRLLVRTSRIPPYRKI